MTERELDEKLIGGISAEDQYRNILTDCPFHAAACDETIGRLSRKADTRDERSYVRIWAPVITAFTRWVLRETAKMGIKRIYFLARDAYPFYLVARELMKGDDPRDIRYLKVSRYALRLPEASVINDHFLDQLFLCGQDVTMRKLLKRGRIEGEDMEKACEILGFDDHPDRILDRAEILMLKKTAKKHAAELYSLVERYAIPAYEPAKGYLIQEGLADDVPFAIVDSGWVGSIQRSITAVMGRELKRPIEGFYFGLYEMPDDVDPAHYHTFYFSPRGNIRRKATFSNCLFETVCAGPGGMTVGYRKVADGYEPVSYSKDVGANDAYTDRMLPYLTEYAAALGRLTRKFARQESEADLERERNMCDKLLTRLMRYPSDREVLLYGDLLFSDDVLEDDLRPVATPLSYEDIKDLEISRKVMRVIGLRNLRTLHESSWIYGSIVRCGRQVKRRSKAAQRYQMLLRWRKSLKWVLRHRI